jgi:hypothetical protein
MKPVCVEEGRDRVRVSLNIFGVLACEGVRMLQRAVKREWSKCLARSVHCFIVPSQNEQTTTLKLQPPQRQ